MRLLRLLSVDSTNFFLLFLLVFRAQRTGLETDHVSFPPICCVHISPVDLRRRSRLEHTASYALILYASPADAARAAGELNGWMIQDVRVQCGLSVSFALFVSRVDVILMDVIFA